MAFNAQSFLADPKTYLGTRRFLTPGNRSDSSLDISGRSSAFGMEIITVNNASSFKTYGANDNTQANSYDISPAGDAFTGFWLPWNDDKAFVLHLTDKYSYFITAKMNSCGFIVGEKDGIPVAVHANITASVPDPPSTFGMGKDEATELGRSHQSNVNAVYKLAYGNLAAKLISDGIFGAKPNVSVMDPEFYLTAKSGSASVFGVKQSGGWKFFTNIHCVGNKGVTIELWPNQPKTLPVL